MKRSGIERRTEMKRTAFTRKPFTRKPSTRTRRLYQNIDTEITELDEAWAVDPFWPVARLVALRRDRFTCARCGHPGGDVHHRYAKQAGGRLDDPERHAPERLITLCREDHGWVHRNPTAAAAIGLRVPVTDDCLRVPCQTWTGVIMLSHDGRMSTTQPRLRG